MWEVNNAKDILMMCDNKSAIEYACNVMRYPIINCKIPDYDIFSTIRALLKDEHFSGKHVKGHQDEQKGELDLFANLNIEADHLAEEAHLAMPQDYEFSKRLQHEKWALEIEGNKVVRQVDDTIREHIYQPSIKEFWHRKARVSVEGFEQVIWSSMKKAMQTSSVQTRHWIVKRAAQDCGTNAIMFQRKQRAYDTCPFCTESESVLHVYRCQAQEVKELWRKSIYELEQELIKYQTDPEIVSQLCQGLLQWQNGTLDNTKELIVHQSVIGWNGILEGCLSQVWVDEQDQFYSNNNIQKSGLGWAQLVIKRLWKIAWSLWENRNLKEHEQDTYREASKLQSQVEEEISVGAEGVPGLAFMFSEGEIEKVRGTNMAYKRAWLRNIKVRRKRAEQHDEDSRTMQSMRNTMRRFLNRT
jgi:hypothetical protein